MEFTGAEDEARTRDLNLGKVALYQLSYFRVKYRVAKIRQCTISEKSFFRQCPLFILGCIEGIAGDFDVRFALISVCVQTERGADEEGDNAKNLQIEKEYGGIDPAIGEIFQFRVFQFYWLICYLLIHSCLIAVQK